MYSDIWRNEDYRIEKNTIIPTVVYKKVWLDLDGNIIGVGLDFEEASDVHFEFLYDQWNSFLKKIFGDVLVTKEELRKYLENKGWIGLYKDLDKLEIVYNRISFE